MYKNTKQYAWSTHVYGISILKLPSINGEKMSFCISFPLCSYAYTFRQIVIFQQQVQTIYINDGCTINKNNTAKANVHIQNMEQINNNEMTNSKFYACILFSDVWIPTSLSEPAHYSIFPPPVQVSCMTNWWFIQ